MPPRKIVIKKYENRRLYDTTNKRYINLEEIAQMVRDGHEVTVVDATSGEDLTRLILAQIVVENAKTPDSVFPVEILRQMIVVSGEATQENAIRYTKMMVEMYRNAFQTIPPAMNPFHFMPWMPGAEHAAPEEPSSEPRDQAKKPASEPQTSSNESEVEALRRRVEQLESQSRRPAKKSVKKKAKPRSKKD